MLYEIHMLKNYPSTNLNRDDTGTPKTCVFGGVARGRISSQCLKHSWRTFPVFKELVGASNLGVRTREMPGLVARALLARNYEEKQFQPFLSPMTGIANKDGEENKDGLRTAQVIFYAPEDIEAVADVVETYIKSGVKKVSSKEIQNNIKNASVRPITLEIALFGRMVTSDAFRNVEASMQVAHAVSTNRITLESDYFTAMDEMLKGDNLESAGSAMIGNTDYNSACYYIYASIDSEALRENLRFGENPDLLVRKTIPALLQTMAWSNPTGKQNSFAGHVLPSAVLVECKENKIPVSYVNAFVEPAYATQKRDLVAASAEKLVQECDMVARNFGISVAKRLWFCVDKYSIAPQQQSVSCAAFGALVEEVASTLG